MSGGRFSLSLLALLMASCARSLVVPTAVPLPATPHWIAHRGASATHPENTCSAVRAAGAFSPRPHFVEIDVQLSRDGVPVVIHDDELMRTTGARGRVSSSDWSRLQTLRAGFAERFGSQYAEEPLPRLGQVLDAAQEAGVGLMIEIKARAAGEVVGRLLRERDEIDQHLVASFAPAALVGASRAAPGVRTLLLASDPVRADLMLANELDATILGCSQDHVDANLVASAHRAGLLLWVYTVNEAERAEELLGWGVDGIISDQVDAVRAALAHAD